MELDVFISESLKAIIKGVKDTQEYAIENGARVNPHVGSWDVKKIATTYYGKEEGARAISRISFDIAVTTATEKKRSGSAGIAVLSAVVGGDRSKKDINEAISRIAFSVSVALPNMEP